MPTYQLSDPYFNEFVFNAIMKATADQKSRLPFDLYAVATSPTRAKQFVDHSKLDKKIAMLSYLGISFAMWFAPEDEMSPEKIKEMSSELQTDRLSVMRKMIATKSFVVTDRNYMTMLAMMAQTCHHETYMINRDYYELGENISSLDGKQPNSIEAAKPAMSEYTKVMKFCLQMILHRDFVDGLTGNKDLELAILLYLFINRNSYVDSKAILDYLYPAFIKNSVRTGLLRLKLKSLVDRLPASNKYAITSYGMNIVSRYLTRLVNHTFNY